MTIILKIPTNKYHAKKNVLLISGQLDIVFVSEVIVTDTILVVYCFSGVLGYQLVLFGVLMLLRPKVSFYLLRCRWFCELRLLSVIVNET